MKFICSPEWLILAIAASGFIFPTTAFQPPQLPMAPVTCSSSSSALFMAKSRKARRSQKVDKSRPQSFYDAIKEASDKPVIEDPPPKEKKEEAEDQPPPQPRLSQDELDREARKREAQERMDRRPELSTMLVDEETGIEVVVQGKMVMDVVTRKAVELSPLGPEYRMAQMIPGVPPHIREKYRVDWNTISIGTMVEQLREACSVKGEIPPHPSVTNKSIDYILANRDYMSYRMKRTLGRIQLNAMSNRNVEAAREYKKLWLKFLTLENHISAPFRQMMMDAEGRVGPNFGNLDIKSFCNGELYERCANYLVLKGMVAHWEKKVLDADYLEKTPVTKDNYITVLSHGDPKRYLPDPPILFTLKECTQVCYMAQQMTKAFVETPELFNDLPAEIRFLEQALTIKGGTLLRKFMVEEFCPAEGITPQGLREGLRRLYAQLENMQIDPYADICNIIERLTLALSMGTEDERNPYIEYLANRDPNGPGSFQTYTFNHAKLSLVRFLDNQYPSVGSMSLPAGGVGGAVGGGLDGLFNFGVVEQKKPKVERPAAIDGEDVYVVPKERAAGRPHNLGWLDLLDNDDKDPKMRLGQVPAGRIIPDNEL